MVALIERSRSLRREALAQYVFLGMQIAYPMAVAAILIASIGLTNYGELAPLLVLCAITAIVVDFGANLFAPIRLGRISGRARFDRAVAAIACLRLIIGVVVCLVALCTVRHLVPSVHPTFSMCMVLATVASVALSSHTVAYASRNMMGFVRITASVRGFALLAMLAMVAVSDDGRAIVAAYVVSALAAAALTAPWRALTSTVNPRLLAATKVQAIRIGRHGATQLVSSLGLQLPYLVAGALLPSEGTGALHLGGTVVRGVASLAEPLALAGHAQFGPLANQANAAAARLRRQLNSLQLMVASVGALALLILGVGLQRASGVALHGIDVVGKVLLAQFPIPVFVAASNIVLYRYIAQQRDKLAHLWIVVVGVLMLSALCVAGGQMAGLSGLAMAVSFHELGTAAAFAALYWTTRRQPGNNVWKN